MTVYVIFSASTVTEYALFARRFANASLWCFLFVMDNNHCFSGLIVGAVACLRATLRALWK